MQSLAIEYLPDWYFRGWFAVASVESTLLYNGYGEQVAHLYKDTKGQKLFM